MNFSVMTYLPVPTAGTGSTASEGGLHVLGESAAPQHPAPTRTDGDSTTTATRTVPSQPAATPGTASDGSARPMPASGGDATLGNTGPGNAAHDSAAHSAAPHRGERPDSVTLRPAATAGASSPAPAVRRDSLQADMPDSLRGADSLGAQAGDSLWQNPLNAFMPGDSLYKTATSFHYLPDGTPLEEFRTVGAEELFGTQATLALPDRIPAPALPRLTDEVSFQGLVLLLSVIFGLLLYQYPNDIRALIARVAFERRQSERSSEETGNAGFTRFLNIALVLGILFAGVSAVRLCDRPEIGPALLREAGGGVSLLLTLGVALASLLFYLYGILLLRIVGGVTLTGPFVTQLIRIKRGYAALGAVSLAPVVLLFALSPQGSDAVWISLLAAGLFITFLLYLRETFALFISKKVSILHWILYLCAVEIFPVSLLWQLVVRLGAQP